MLPLVINAGMSEGRTVYQTGPISYPPKKKCNLCLDLVPISRWHFGQRAIRLLILLSPGSPFLWWICPPLLMLAGFPPLPCRHFLLPQRQCWPLFTRSLWALGSRDIYHTSLTHLSCSFVWILPPALCRSFLTSITSLLPPLSTLCSGTRLLAYMRNASTCSSVWHLSISS